MEHQQVVLYTAVTTPVTLCTGDAAQHVMWRLRNGEGLISAGPQLAVIMLGSSDLTYASLTVALTFFLAPSPPTPPPPPQPSPWWPQLNST